MAEKTLNYTHNDEPVLIDRLQREDLIKLIVHQIVNSTPPKAMAVHGTWGTGKTSLLIQIYEELGGHLFTTRGEEDRDIKPISNNGFIIRPVWFEAWQYQNESNILAALLKEIRDQLAWYHKVWQQVKETAIPGLLAFLQSIDITIKSFGTEFGIKSMGQKFADNEKAYQKEQYSTPLETHTLKNLLQDAINKLIGIMDVVKSLNNNEGYKSTRGKVVIFIDDLDRCEPDTAFKILEAIKIYLNLNNCVFVLGMDIQAVERIIAKYYEKMLVPDKEGNNHLAKLKDLSRLYLEKICQDVYHLPIPEQKTRIDYFQELLTGRLGGTGTTQKPVLEKIIKTANQYSFLPPFPRSIKILANVIISHLHKPAISEYVSKDGKEMQRLLIFAYLYAFHYELYNLCFMYREKKFYEGTFLTYCEGKLDLSQSAGGSEKISNHPLLESLVVPEDLTADEALGGKTRKDFAKDHLARMFPHESLRQVLWIRRLVMETGAIPDSDFAIIKL